MLPILFIGGGLAALAALFIYVADVQPVPDHQPDVPAGTPGSTGYKRVDAILPALKTAAAAADIPLGLMVGWIAKESGGRLDEKTRYDERGYFQLMPDESKALGLDHQRLSTDSDYSIHAGVLLIKKYALLADGYGIFVKGSSDYWRLVKLIHTVGNGDVKSLVSAATTAGALSSWNTFEQFALSGGAHTKHSPSKWFPLVDKVYMVGLPFGFGHESVLVAGDYEELAENGVQGKILARAIESSCPNGTINEKQAVAWVCRNRAVKLGVTIEKLLIPNGEYGPRGAGGRTFVSTQAPASEESKNVAFAVLALPQESDPTGGAVDFWNPTQQARLYGLSAALDGGDVVPNEDQMREVLATCGLRPCGTVGNIELLCAGNQASG